MRFNKKPINNTGFTLIELMIATTVFSVIMLISTYGFMNINRHYTKGINLVRTQDSARNVVADISNQIQFTVGDFNSGQHDEETNSGYFCISNKRYDYKINVPEGQDIAGVIQHALTATELTSTDCATLQGDTKVLLAKDTRLLDIYVRQNSLSVYDIGISLINLPDDGDDLITVDDDDPDDTTKWFCKGGNGSQFCSYARVKTTVYRRLTTD